MSLEPGAKLAPYEILSPIGAGGMGVVYRARDTKLGRNVAIKVLRKELASEPERLRRFEKEARAASALNHPNIIHIYDIDKYGSTPYIAMELVEGKTLRDTLREAPLSTKELLQLGAQIAEGLAKAHAAGIVHRDLKPENLMVTSDGFVKILDFGLAKLLPESMEIGSEKTTVAKEATHPGTVMGTVGYMSPEQAKGQAVDYRSDQFSFGSILYEMATGNRAFHRDSSVQTLSAIIEKEPEPITTMNPSIPVHLQLIVERCLAKRPEARYDSTRDLARELRSVEEELPRHTPARAPAPGTASAIESIAVLPLVDLKPEPGEEYYADGMTEALIANLAKIGSLRVISRTSAMRYKNTDKSLPEIARELNVDSVLEGSIFRAGDRVRITAQLIKADTDEHLWAETYDRDLRDIFALHSELATSIAKEIKVKLTPGERKRLARVRQVEPKAYQVYLKGRYYLNLISEESFKRSIDCFEKAIEIDPLYAEAYAGLADVYNEAWWPGLLSPMEGNPRARTAAKKALKIDDALPEAHTSLGYTATWYDWDWATGGRELRRAIELNPSHAYARWLYAYHLAALERFDEAIEEIHEAQKLDPLSPLISASVAGPYLFSGQHEKALEHSRHVLELYPDFDYAHWQRGSNFVSQKRYEDAIEGFQKAVTLSDDNPQYLGALGFAFGAAGNKAKAESILTELKRSQRRYVSSSSFAHIYVGLDDTDQAFEWLNKAYEEHDGWLTYLQVDPLIERLRPDPRYRDLRRRMNFPD